MNPLTNVKNITKLNEREISLGTKGSWHDQYKDSAWIFIGGLPYDLTEGDIICVFSQFGEIANINMIRDQKTGKTKGFCFLCYENQKSTTLAVDNLNGIKLLGRIIRVDHVQNYKPPKEREDEDEITQSLRLKGCAPQTLAETNKQSQVTSDDHKSKTSQSSKREQEEDKMSQKRRHRHRSGSSDEIGHSRLDVKIKIEKKDPGYDKYVHKTHHKEKKRLSDRHKHKHSFRDRKKDQNLTNKEDRYAKNRN